MEQHDLRSEKDTLREINDALSAEIRNPKQGEIDLAERENRRISRIGNLLRYTGICLLLLGVGSLLLQRWGLVNHLERYFLFLGFTGTVCGAGLWCGLRVGENKGARTLLGVVTALIPVHCAQIGALLYSQFGTNFSNHPSFLRWDPGNMTNALTALAVGLTAMIPMGYLSYAVLARRYATPLCLLGFGVSGLLIVPTREPVAVSALVLAGIIAVLFAERRFLRISELSTREALTARAVPVIAMTLLIGRQYLYDPSSFFLGTLLGFVAVGLLSSAKLLSPNRWAMVGVEFASLLCAMTAGWFCTSGVLDSFHLWKSVAAPMIVGGPIVVGLTLMGFRARVLPRLFHGNAATILMLTGFIELIHFDPSGGFLALLCGIMAILWACITEKRVLLYIGILLSIISLFDIVRLILMGLSADFWWITLSILGVTTIVGASYFERYFGELKATVQGLRRRVATWN